MKKDAKSVDNSKISGNLKFLKDYLSTREVPHFAVTLPLPPSMNVYWRNFRGHTILSKEAREYKLRAEALIGNSRGMTFGAKAVDVLLVCHFGDRRRRDVDNYIKPVLDSLKGIVFDDDSQVVIIAACKIVGKESKMDVIVCEH